MLIKRSLYFSDFYYSYGRHSALKISGLELPENSVIAVIGHNGAGKSTFVKCLCGFQRGFKGKVIMDGSTYNSRKMRKISYMVMQDVNHQLFAETVLEEVVKYLFSSSKVAEQPPRLATTTLAPTFIVLSK